MASDLRLKLPGHDGPGAQLRLLDGGSFSTGSMSLLHQNSSPEPFRMYDWCFMIHHEASGRHILWDLGCSDDHDVYTPWVRKFMLPKANIVGPRKSLRQQLNELGVSADQIDSVVFSKEFPKAKAFFGPGTKAFCSPGHLESGEASDEVEWDGKWFGSLKYVTEDWDELSGSWVPWGPFERAFDFFGDGSFWILDAPGHMPGNLGAAVKLQGGEDWVLLGGDCCHSMQVLRCFPLAAQRTKVYFRVPLILLIVISALLRGEKEMATYIAEDGKVAAWLHKDIPAANKTIDKIRTAEAQFGVHVALAHDATWMIDQSDPVLMSLLSDSKKGKWLERVTQGLRP
ncbi:unnamed protein product [Clonostachys rosea]|uniref:Metallo-beta-lactamase domain-containing protein n=1 Tax=Bionectria ochroleuca TaxID=29856 RepID=A0ABY6V0R5_BIOOC|nr:unnamed protein product [Clonostachys rosea]